MTHLLVELVQGVLVGLQLLLHLTQRQTHQRLDQFPRIMGGLELGVNRQNLGIFLTNHRQEHVGSFGRQHSFLSQLHDNAT